VAQKVAATAEGSGVGIGSIVAPVTLGPVASEPLEPLRLQPWSGPLFAERFGVTTDRMAFVHGFTQTGRSWLPLAAAFARDHELLLIDAPGHGGSSDVRTDLRRGADLLAATAGESIYVGYSMGGRLCLHLALTYPHLVRSLVLISTTAGIAEDAMRAARRDADDALALDIETDGVDPFLRRWLAQPLFEGLAVSEAERTDRLRNTADGLASSLRMSGTGTQDPLWARLHELTMPVLVLAGDRDTKFTDIGRQLVEGMSRATFATVPGAGHAAPLEQPIATAAIIAAWLAERQSR
jgi:2-succinyl-6-hydroxy-2,4-cyclohexadiene-1-carboxylate synthase